MVSMCVLFVKIALVVVCVSFSTMEFVVKSGILTLTLAPLTLVPLLALVSVVVLILVLVLGLLILRPCLGLLSLP